VILGAHCSTAGGVHKALQRAKTIGADSCQIFVKNNMQWLGRPQTSQELSLYANELAADSLKSVFGHTGYLINLGAPPSENRDRSIASLIQEIQLATAAPRNLRARSSPHSINTFIEDTLRMQVEAFLSSPHALR